MPTNVFGYNDNYNLNKSHFIQALIKKIHNASLLNKKYIEVWVTGRPKRELIYLDDLADAIIYFMNKKTKENLINIGTGFEFTINQFAKILINISNKKLKIKNIKKNMNGVKRKLLDTSLAKKYGWKSKSNIKQKLEQTYKYYVNNLKDLRN